MRIVALSRFIRRCPRNSRAIRPRTFGVLILSMTLFAAQSLAYEGDPRMAEIANNVRANEEIYRNIETVTHMTYKLNPNAKFKARSALEAETTRCRAVLQGDFIYLKIDNHAVDRQKKEQRVDTVQGFDGSRTRNVEQHAFANIHEGRVVDYRIKRFNPYTMHFWRWPEIDFPLSTLLQGTSAVRSHPKWEHHNVELSFRGEAEIDGLRCVKIRCCFWPDGFAEPREKAAYWVFWLAVDRNYLPVRQEVCTGRIHMHKNGQPAYVGTLNDLAEVSPGVWYPMRATFVAYDTSAFVEDHKLVVNNSEEYVVEKVDLSPHYDISLFRDIPIPKGMLVYHVRNGQIYKTTKEGFGEVRHEHPGGWPGWWPAPVALVACGAGAFAYRRARRKTVIRSA